MHILCQRTTLTNAFQTVAGVVPSRTTKDILKNIKLVVAGGKATLIGNDSEIGIRCNLPDIEADSSGEALLPTARVLSVLRELTDDVVKLEITGDAIWIRCGYSEFRLSAEDPACGEAAVRSLDVPLVDPAADAADAAAWAVSAVAG